MKKSRIFAIMIVFFTFLTLCFAFFKNEDNAFAYQKFETKAKAMAVVEKTSGRLLYSKNEEEKLPMASTTKIITAIYVIENCDDLDKVVCIPKEATNIEGTSIGLKEGEHLSIRELLYGLMLRSGNDCAVALSIAIGSSEENFINNVNEFIKSLGLNNTHLANPHGLPCEDHYTTAYDLALITAYALKNPTFAEIVSTKEKRVSNELKSKFNRNLINKNKMLSNFEFADGVKTGYTRKAGRCFVGSATMNGMQVVCVLLNCVPMFEECEQLLRNAFEEFSLYKLVSEGDKLGSVQVTNSKVETIDVFAESDFYYPLRKDEVKKVKLNVDLLSEVKAPVSKGCELGSLEITFENQLIFSKKIYSIIDIEANDIGTKINKIIEKM